MRKSAALYGLVALGTSIGGTFRALASFLPVGAFWFPWTTLFVNVVGSFVISVYATLAGPDGRLMSSTRQRHFVMTGFCGGFTSFSIFSVETVRFLQSGQPARAALTVVVSVAAWLVAAWLGHLLAWRLNRPGGR